MEFLEDCVKRVKIKRVNGGEWLFMEGGCPGCKYSGATTIYYCRNRHVYFAYERDPKQLELPFPRALVIVLDLS